MIDGLIQRVEIFLGWTGLALTALLLWRENRQPVSEVAATRNAVHEVSAD